MESLFIILIGFAVVSLYDVISSILSRVLNFEYVWFAFGSFVIYGITAIYLKLHGTFVSAIIGSFIIGVFDTTVGLIIARIFKAKISDEDKELVKITPMLILQMGVIASIIGAISIIAFI